VQGTSSQNEKGDFDFCIYFNGCKMTCDWHDHGWIIRQMGPWEQTCKSPPARLHGSKAPDWKRHETTANDADVLLFLSFFIVVSVSCGLFCLLVCVLCVALSVFVVFLHPFVVSLFLWGYFALLFGHIVSIFMCVYICKYIYIYKYIYLYLYIYIFIFIYIYL